MKLETNPKLVIHHTLPTAGELKPSLQGEGARGVGADACCVRPHMPRIPADSNVPFQLLDYKGKSQLNLKVQYVAGFFGLYPR